MKCLPTEVNDCDGNGSMAANLATNGDPKYIPHTDTGELLNATLGSFLKLRATSLERMNLAMYLLFGFLKGTQIGRHGNI